MGNSVDDILEMFNVPRESSDNEAVKDEGENDYSVTAKDDAGEKPSFGDALGVVKQSISERAEGLPVKSVDIDAIFQDGADGKKDVVAEEKKDGDGEKDGKDGANEKVTGAEEKIDVADEKAAGAEEKIVGTEEKERDSGGNKVLRRETKKPIVMQEGDHYEMVDGVEVINGEIQWLLECDNERFEDFYKYKNRIIKENLPDGQIPFSQWTKDIQSAYVSIDKHRLYDAEYLNEMLHEVQGWQDRITEIAVQNNASYYIWQTIVAMFEGLLAKTLYEKPALKQQGVNFEHMRDMFLYWSRIKTIHESADIILKNLENKRETISRTVTIVLQNMEPKERVVIRADTPTQSMPQEHRPEPSKTHYPPADLSAFDRLEEGSAVDPKPRGTQEVNWSSMG